VRYGSMSIAMYSSSSFYLNQATWPVHKHTLTYRQTDIISKKKYNKTQ